MLRSVCLTFFTNGFFARNRKSIHTHLLKTERDGTFIISIQNDGKEGGDQNREAYVTRSFNELKNILKKDCFHIYIDKTKISSNNIDFIRGHICSFLTDTHAKVIEDSFVSLRPDGILPGELLFRLPVDEDTLPIRRTVLWGIEFCQFEKEFKKHLFKFDAEKSSAYDRKRFIIGIPMPVLTKQIGYTSDLFISLAGRTKQELVKKKYILCSGKINDEIVNAINCVTAFYNSNNIQGTESDPSPQMAVWSYLKLIFGEKLRDQLIEGTGIKDEHDRLRHDDEIRFK